MEALADPHVRGGDRITLEKRVDKLQKRQKSTAKCTDQIKNTKKRKEQQQQLEPTAIAQCLDQRVRAKEAAEISLRFHPPLCATLAFGL